MKKFKKILLIDDEPIVNFLSEMIFSDIAISEEVISLSNGEEALDYLQKHCLSSIDQCPDLILLDLNMPIMSGKELLYTLKSLEKLDFIKSRIAVLSSSEHHRDMAFLKEMGINEIIVKPLTIDKANSLIKRLQTHSPSV